MARVIVVEDGWDGHYELAMICHQAGHQVVTVQGSGMLATALRAGGADAVVLDATLPGVCLNSIGAMACEVGVPVVATGYALKAGPRGIAAFLAKPAAAAAVLGALQAALRAPDAVAA